LAQTDAQRIQIAESYLQGEAKRSWLTTRRALTNDSNDTYATLTFEQFKEALVKRWDPACTEVVAQHKLDKLKQTGSLPDFVAEFDKLCSYVSDMQDREKVHRFLNSINASIVDMVSTDPTTRQRWTKYDDLRAYALNHAAAASAAAAPARHGPLGRRVHFKRHAEVLGNIRAALDSGNKKPRLTYSEAAAGTSRQAGQQQEGKGRFLTLKNGKGIEFSRHASLVRWCHGNSVCLTCFSKYDNSTMHQHRGNCPRPPAKGFPTGYSPK